MELFGADDGEFSQITLLSSTNRTDAGPDHLISVEVAS